VPPSDNPAAVERYARAAAAESGLNIEEGWWPSVVGHLAALLDRAASLEGAPEDLPDDPAPVFRP
jgi:hypothetical protein